MSTKLADDKPKQVKTPSLDLYSQDLTMLAQHGKLDRIIGRTSEIQRCCQILARRKKNNPLLIGEAGVGKTQIAQGVAQMIAEKKVAKCLLNKRVLLLDLTLVVAGTTFRGDFEDRMKKIIAECVNAKDVILFIDEIHTVMGAGSVSGSMDAANILKPALADGSIQMMGATTLKEYRENIEDDGAMTRRFQNVMVEPTSIEDTIEILTGLKPIYEKFHKISYDDAAIEACVKLSDKFMPDRVLPDKAIDLMDEAGARANVLVPEDLAEMPNDIKELKAELVRLDNEKNMLKVAQRYEECAEIQQTAREIKAIHDEKMLEWENEFRTAKNVSTITLETIQELIFQTTGIPTSKMDEKDLSEMRNMKSHMLSYVIGQDDAVSSTVKAIRRARLGLKKENRPISMMFIGSTGVGKTHVAKALAREMFGSDTHFYKFDMSEYSQEFNASRLIGAPPGYVGYKEGGELTEKIRRNPYSVILLDEIEKAHWTIYNLLLQALEDGYLTDGLKRKCHLKNTIIIFTSNVGAKKLQENGVGVGFATSTREANRKEMENAVLEKELKKAFSPEFLNRIDETIYFNSLEREDILKITKLEVDEAVSRIEKLGLTVDYDIDVIKFIADRGFNKEMGARPLYRTLQSHLEDMVADELVEENIKDGDHITIRVQEGKLACGINMKEQVSKR